MSGTGAAGCSATPHDMGSATAENMPDFVLGMVASSLCLLLLWLFLRWLADRLRGQEPTHEIPGASTGLVMHRFTQLSASTATTNSSMKASSLWQPLLKLPEGWPRQRGLSGASASPQENGGGPMHSPRTSEGAQEAGSLQLVLNTPGCGVCGRGSVASSRGPCADSRQQNVHISMENYLCFLRICRDMFAVLSVLSVFMTAPLWGFHPLLAGVMGGCASLTAPLSQGRNEYAGDLALPMIKTLYSTTLLYGIVFVAFIARFQQECQLRGKLVADSPAKRKMRRTVWLQRLPLSDGVWGAKEFEYTQEDLERVTQDLWAEICKFLKERRPPSAPQLPQAPRQRFKEHRSNSWHCGERQMSDSALMPSSGSSLLPRTASPIESIEICTHIEELASVSHRRRDAAELAEMYDTLRKTRGKSGPRCIRCWYRRWYGRRQRLFKRRLEELRAKQLCIELERKRLSGSAFITFAHQNDCNLMLNKVPPWWDCQHWFFRNTFSFGRPPFAAVTLFVYRAPHPDDVNWQNLHTKSAARRLRYWILTVAVAALAVSLSAGVERWTQVLMAISLRDTRPSAKLLSALPPVCLLLINNLILPYSILHIALAERNRQKSNEELRQLYINFHFLVLTGIVLPFLGFDTLSQLVDMCWVWLQQKPIDNVAEELGSKLLNTSGNFTLRYMMSAVFLSNPFVLLKVPLVALFQMLRGRVFALPPREKLDNQKPIAFAWGFWYAWVLIIAGSGVIYSVVLPSLLPIMALFFATRRWVEEHNLRRGCVDASTDSEGTYAAAAVYHMMIVGVVWWCLMGVFFYTVCRQANDCPAWLSPYGCGLLLLAPVVVVLPVSWLNKRHTFLGLSSEKRGEHSLLEEVANERADEVNWQATQVVEKDPVIEEVRRLLQIRSETDPKAREVVLQKLREGGTTVEEVKNQLLFLDSGGDGSPSPVVPPI